MEFSYFDLIHAAFWGGVLGSMISYFFAEFAYWVTSFIRSFLSLDKK